MKIAFVEIQNFRKLKSVRVDFADETTLLVGANNSGKTSAMVALRHFLITRNAFSTNDFTLSNWAAINKLGAEWVANAGKEGAQVPTLESWVGLMPTMDVWLDVGSDEIHYVAHMLPTLNWTAGKLGVRLRLEPKKFDDLYAEFLSAVSVASETKSAAQKIQKENGSEEVNLRLWPQSLRDFLDRRLSGLLEIKAYTLDPEKCAVPKLGEAQPQQLPQDAEELQGNPFKGLIRIDEVHAQRGFSDASAGKAQDGVAGKDNRRLSEQLKGYYSRHLDPSDLPEASDLGALQAIDNAQAIFDTKLQAGFGPALKEMESLGYPGVTDPKLIITTLIKPVDSLDHDSAVQYEVIPAGSEDVGILRLPEDYNGLGYQNLISIVFRLMSFRDGWMRVGKASRKRSDEDAEEIPFPPLHLVLIEEPEAHLHAQVQQVFIRKAYSILRAHPDLGENVERKTQLVISTHSSHIAHESAFSSLRYFRRLPSSAKGQVPYSTVINLSEVFGVADETRRFVIRYLKATHCDLFFADAAILVEGAAERMLVPHFLRSKYPKLNQAYITVLEISGSHAHRLRQLIDKLGLITLVITDLDSIAADTRKAVPVVKGSGQLSNNFTLKEWAPKREGVDELLALGAKDKEIPHDEFFAVRIAYQTSVQIKVPKAQGLEEACPTTFEDALAFANLEVFAALDGKGLIKKFKDEILDAASSAELANKLHEALRSGSKAEFALDLLFIEDPAKLAVPEYIAEGLSWLEGQVARKHQETVLQTEAAKEAAK